MRVCCGSRPYPQPRIPHIYANLKAMLRQVAGILTIYHKNVKTPYIGVRCKKPATCRNLIAWIGIPKRFWEVAGATPLPPPCKVHIYATGI